MGEFLAIVSEFGLVFVRLKLPTKLKVVAVASDD